MTVSASDKKSEFLAGIRDELPLQLGVFPFGLVFGIAGIESGLSALQTFFLSTILFGGASQIVFIQLIASGTPLPVLIASVSTINLRHALYGVSVSRYLQHLPVGWRIILGYLLTDEAYAISIRRFTMQPASAYMHFHLLGTGLTLWLCWLCYPAYFYCGDYPPATADADACCNSCVRRYRSDAARNAMEFMAYYCCVCRHHSSCYC